MPDDVPPPPFRQRFRRGLRQHRAAVSLAVLAIGVLLSALAIGFFTPLHTAGPFPAINDVTNHNGVNYNLLFVFLGPIIVIIGGYLVGAYFSARRQFEHLMLTKSKAEFLRNIPKIEDLLWDLTPTDEDRYVTKRADFRLRR